MYSFVVELPDEIAAEVSKVDRRSSTPRWRWSGAGRSTTPSPSTSPGPYRCPISPTSTTTRRSHTSGGAMTCSAAGCRAGPCPEQSDLERITALVTDLEQERPVGRSRDRSRTARVSARACSGDGAGCSRCARAGIGGEFRRPPTTRWATSTCVGRISRHERIRRGPRCS